MDNLNQKPIKNETKKPKLKTKRIFDQKASQTPNQNLAKKVTRIITKNQIMNKTKNLCRNQTET